MNAEEKQALIEWLEEGVACSDEYGFSGNILKSMKVALAALTAQPVKLPKSFSTAISSIAFGAFMRMSSKGSWLNRHLVIKAIRDAGYEVKQ